MKIIKRIAIGSGILVVLFLATCGWFGYKMYSETSMMHPSDTKEITGGIYAIKDSTVNLFILKSSSGFIAVDTGMNRENVKLEMDKLKIDPDKVTAVLLTHTDLDHIGALKLFKNAKIYISTDEEQMIDGTTSKMFFIKNRLDIPYEMLEDNQTLDFSGLKVKGILTPGHTPGSISYLVDDKYLFTGDTLSLKDQKAELFNEFFNMDSAAEEKSFKKLAGLSSVKYIFTAHYGYTDDFYKAMDGWKSK